MDVDLTPRRSTGLLDREGVEIIDGDMVSLDGNMTADDGMGELPNGYVFDESDVYRVYWDERINNWSLECGVEPDSNVNIHYLNHAVGLLHDQAVTRVSVQ